MKIIVSHDVDHLYTSDHYLRDLIVEKLIVRSFLQLLKKRIDLHTFISRVGMVFSNKMNNIGELVHFDTLNQIPSTFFFGMSNGMGMSYSRKRAVRFIQMVLKSGLDVGVHGIEFELENEMANEYKSFENMVGDIRFGVRNHYVRFNMETFEKMERVGYLFDSTRFNKKEIELLNPYKVGKMWEFPLHIMDAYICNTGDYREDLRQTIKIIEKADQVGIRYLTILFHDDEFNHDVYPEEYDWYINLIDYFKRNGYEFISYKNAIEELEACE